MKLYIDESYIPEEKESLNPNTSYAVMLTDKEKTSLEKLQKRFEHLIDKRKDELSSFVKVVLLNTYLYLNNTERDLVDDINSILKKSYYKDLDKDFIKMISESGKAQDFIREIVRTRILKTQSSTTEDEESEKEKFQFRLAKDDELLRYIFAGTVSMSISDYLTSLMDYFLSAPSPTQRTILQYQIILALKRCTSDSRCIMINGRKRYPVIFSKAKGPLNRLWVLNRKNNTIRQLPIMLIKEIAETNEYFSLTSNEQRVINMIKDIGDVTITFKIINKTEITKWYIDEMNLLSRFIYKYDEETKQITITVTLLRAMLESRKLTSLNGTDISDLKFSDGFEELLKVLEETGTKLI